ncbi:hypothetical protein [Nocardioides sp.]|uniref:hypothetical protein n=1 Tax=Nocardioides sp. TaxID=35761 RepID=UPI003D0F321C
MLKPLFIASLVLVAATSVACGGSDGSSSAGAPTDASKADFCKVITDSDAKTTGEDIADTLSEVGTPKGITDEARSGFELFVKKVKDLDADASSADFDKLQKSLSADELKEFTAFITYVSTECV